MKKTRRCGSVLRKTAVGLLQQITERPVREAAQAGRSLCVFVIRLKHHTHTYTPPSLSRSLRWNGYCVHDRCASF